MEHCTLSDAVGNWRQVQQFAEGQPDSVMPGTGGWLSNDGKKQPAKRFCGAFMKLLLPYACGCTLPGRLSGF